MVSLFFVLKYNYGNMIKVSSNLTKCFAVASILHWHDDVITWKHFPRYWPFVLGIHRSPVNSSRKGQWHGALMFSLICARINGWVNNRKAGYLRRDRTHCDVIVMGLYVLGVESQVISMMTQVLLMILWLATGCMVRRESVWHNLLLQLGKVAPR